MKPVTGYVAFLDVLGFADLIARDDRLDAVGGYVEAVKASVPVAAEAGSLRFVLFSDSIIISSEGEDPDALLPLLEKLAPECLGPYSAWRCPCVAPSHMVDSYARSRAKALRL
jgi:hypothetical protein